MRSIRYGIARKEGRKRQVRELVVVVRQKGRDTMLTFLACVNQEVLRARCGVPAGVCSIDGRGHGTQKYPVEACGEQVRAECGPFNGLDG